MRVAVLGLWHLGSVTAACLAQAGHEVVGWDPDAATVDRLAAGHPPVDEPGLAALVGEQLAAGRLRFVREVREALARAEVAWLTFDTPVDADDRADVELVVGHARAAFPALADGTLVLVSSQLPVGTVRRLERTFAEQAGGRRVSFAASPENLRLGKALEAFRQPARVVIGVRAAADRKRLAELFAPVTSAIEWVSVESAEMTKHALNAFLGLSVAYINELAGLCEEVGADAREVERGLKSEPRIGPRAYLSPGGAFAGGTLARDVAFLRDLGRVHSRATPLVDGIEASNRAHRRWPELRLTQELGGLAERRVAIWGLTYKPGTDTLRRSTAIELCRWLVEAGAAVRVHDPAAGELPAALATVVRSNDPLAAAEGADALVVATEWPLYRTIDADRLWSVMPAGLVLDPNLFLGPVIGKDPRFRVVSVGAAAAPSAS